MKERIKQISASLLAAIMVFTFMPVFGLGAYDTYADPYDYSTNVEIPDQAWTGGEINLNTVPELAEIYVAPAGTTTYNLKLVRGEDFEVVANKTTLGEAEAVFTCEGNYAGKTIEPAKFHIVDPDDTAEYVATVDASTLVYKGSAYTEAEVATLIKNNTDVIKNGKQLVDKKDVTVTATAKTTDLTNAGAEFTVSVKVGDAVAKIDGEDTTTVAIDKFDLANGKYVAHGVSGLTYNAQEQKPTFTTVDPAVGFTGPVPVAADFELTGNYKDATNATVEKSAYAEIKAKADSKNFKGTGKASFEIAQKEISSEMKLVVGELKEYTYTGSPIKPEGLTAEAYFKDSIARDKIPAADYEVDFFTTGGDSDYTTPGTKKITIKPSANKNLKVGTTQPKEDAFIINKASAANLEITRKEAPIYKSTVSGLTDISTFKQYFTVKFNGETIDPAAADYTVAVTGGAKVGAEGTVTLTATENNKNFSGKSAAADFTVVAKKFAKTYTSNLNNLTYDGETKRPASLGTLSKKDPTEEGENSPTAAMYDIDETTFADNINAGTATVKIKGKNDYESAEATVEFTINAVSIPGNTSWNDQQGDHRTKVTAVTGLTAGAYCEGDVISGATATLTYYTRTGSWQQRTYTAHEIKLGADDCTVTVDQISNNKITRVLVTPKRNYRASDWTGNNYNAGLYTLATPVDADRVDLEQATVTATIPAGLKVYNSTNLKQYFTVVSKDGVTIDPSKYNLTVGSVSEPAKVVPGTEISYEITPVSSAHLKNSNEGIAVVAAKSIANATVTLTNLPGDNYTYNGDAHRKGVAVNAGSEFQNLVEDVDFTVDYNNSNIDAGTAKVTVKGIGKFEGSVDKTFTIAAATPGVEGGIWKLSDLDKSMNEYKAGEPVDHSADLELVSVPAGSKYKFVKDKDYKIELVKGQKDTRNVAYTVTFLADGNYVAGPATATCVLDPKTVSNPAVTITSMDGETQLDNAVVYNQTYGSAAGYKADLTVTVVVDDVTLKEGTDYTFECTGKNKTLGEYEEGFEPKVVVTYAGNYVGTTVKGFDILEDIVTAEELSYVKLTAPTPAQSVFSGKAIGVTASDLSKKLAGKYKVVYTYPDGEAYDAAPKNVGTYTATVKALPEFGGAEGESVPFTITPQTLTKANFEKKVEDEVVIGSTYGYRDPEKYLYDNDEVMYFGWMTAPVAVKKGTSKVSDQFEIVEPVDWNWDGNPETKGTAVVALKDDANYAYDGTEEVEFTWTQGNLYRIDVNDFFFIPDQPYTGAKVEPTTVEEWNEDNNMPADWVTVTDWENNDLKTEHAKAYVTVEAPDKDLFYVDETYGEYVEFRICTPADIEESADEALDAAATIDSTYPADAKKAVEDAAADLKDLIDGGGTTNQVATATARLNNAILAAEKAKANAVLADAAKITSADYQKAAVDSVNSAKAALNAVLPGSDAAAIKDATKKLDDAVKAAANLKKAESKLVVSKNKTLKAKKSKKTSFKASKAYKISGNAGTLTFQKVKVNKSKYNKKFVVNATSGKVTVKKGVKKGTYKLTVAVTDSGSATVKGATQNVVLKVKVK